MLLPYGLTVDCVTCGRDAVKLIREGKPRYDLIFMDHMMPEMDGIEAVRVIREEIGTDYARTVPVIALTANALAGNDDMFKARGFQDFLSKPIDIMKMDVALNAWVRDAEREKAYLAAMEKAAAVSANGGAVASANGVAVASANGVAVASANGVAVASANGVASANDDTSDKTAAEPRKTPLSERAIEGLDIADALRRFGGKESIYNTILRSFVKSMPELLDKIKPCEADALNDYTIAVHGIKGSCRNIGAKALGDEAEALEMAAKAGDLGKVNAETGALIAGVERLLANIGAALDDL
jgi:CheY-like chemotaxis protein